jgi:anti-sigma factor RsiW
MNPQAGPITEADLQAYVDGQLSESRRIEVETFLAANSEEAERVRAYQKQNEMLRTLFDQIRDEPIPLRLQRPRRLWRSPLMRYATFAACMMVGGFLGWVAHGSQSSRPPEQVAFARQAAMAHAVYTPEVRHPVEVGADQEEHLVNWLSKRLGARLKPPHLSKLGYDLVGGRLLPGSRGPVAQFMYQDEKGQRLTLYVRTDAMANRETAFRFIQEGGVRVFYWLDGQFGYALSGEVEKAELSRVANAVYYQLNP